MCSCCCNICCIFAACTHVPYTVDTIRTVVHFTLRLLLLFFFFSSWFSFFYRVLSYHQPAAASSSLIRTHDAKSSSFCRRILRQLQNLSTSNALVRNYAIPRVLYISLPMFLKSTQVAAFVIPYFRFTPSSLTFRTPSSLTFRTVGCSSIVFFIRSRSSLTFLRASIGMNNFFF